MKDRKAEEAKRLKGSAIDGRLIYYADFYDLSTIIQKHWDGEISQALDDLPTIKVFLKILEGFRNPDAHRRGLLPHQEKLLVGISEEIRNRPVPFTNDYCLGGG